MLCSFLFTGYAMLAQTAPAIEWQKTFGGTVNDGARNIKPTADGGFIIVGSSASVDGDVTQNNGASDFWIVKTNSLGTIEWQKTYGGSNGDIGQDAIQLQDGSYAVVGTLGMYDPNGQGTNGDIWVLKLDNEGNLEWEETLGGSANDSALSIMQDNNGNLVITGTTNSIDGDVTNNNGGLDAWIVKMGLTGTIIWQKTFGGPSAEVAESIIQTAEGGYIFCGYKAGNLYGQFWVVKIDVDGNMQWENTYGGSGEDWPSNIEATTDGGYIIGGESISNDGDVTGAHGFLDYWIVKINATGTLQWQKTLGGSGNDQFSRVKQTADGGYVVAGFSDSNNGDSAPNNGGNDIWVVKLDAQAAVVWQKSYGGSSNESAFNLVLLPDGSVAVAGNTYSTDGNVTGNHGGSDYWLLKLAPEVLSTLQLSKNTFSLYPNPNNGKFTISKDILLEQDASISVYSTLGHLVYISKVTSATVAVPNLAVGVYQVELTSGKSVYSQKLVIE